MPDHDNGIAVIAREKLLTDPEHILAAVLRRWIHPRMDKENLLLLVGRAEGNRTLPHELRQCLCLCRRQRGKLLPRDLAAVRQPQIELPQQRAP